MYDSRYENLSNYHIPISYERPSNWEIHNLQTSHLAIYTRTQKYHRPSPDPNLHDFCEIVFHTTFNIRPETYSRLYTV